MLLGMMLLKYMIMLTMNGPHQPHILVVKIGTVATVVII